MKGKTRERILENKDLAFLSKELGTININAPIEENLEKFKVEEWDKPEVLKLFKELNFNRYIERFNLASEDEIEPEEVAEKYEVQEIDIDKAKEIILKTKELFYHFSTKEVNKPEYIIKKEFESFSFYNKEEKMVAQRAMEKMMIQDLADQCYRELSGGQQQRVLLARALCAAQKILLLDEPVSGLDPRVTAEMYQLIRNLNKKDGITIIMISHDIAAAVKYATHILHIGEHCFFGTKKQYLESSLGKAFTGQEGEDE